MGYEQERRAIPRLQRRKQAGNIRLHHNIQGRSDFITNHQLRRRREGTGNGHPLLFTAG